MRRLALSSLVSLACGCGGMQAGISNDGMSGKNRGQDGCEQDRTFTQCSGQGYDDVAMAVTALLVLTLLLPRLLRRQ